VQNGIALYAAHLPLDVHPEVGNNAQLARIMRLEETAPTGLYHGELLGLGGMLKDGADLSALTRRLEEGMGYDILRVLDAGRAPHRVACVSGGAAEMAGQIAAAGFDTYVTGEVSHTFLPQMEELGINVIFGGHYATESLGVKALSRHLERKFDLETRFIACPTDA